MLFSNGFVAVIVFVLISRTVFVLAVFIVPNVVTATTPLAVPATLALVIVVAVVAIRAFDAVLTVFAIIAILAPNAVLAVHAVNAVNAVCAVHAVDVAVLIGDDVGVGGNGICHGFFSYKLVGVALPK